MVIMDYDEQVVTVKMSSQFENVRTGAYYRPGGYARHRRDLSGTIFVLYYLCRHIMFRLCYMCVIDLNLDHIKNVYVI